MRIFRKRYRKGKGVDGEDIARGSDKGKEKDKAGRIKDLKGENRKKRKEPAKPWGVKERLFLLTVFTVPALFSVVLALSFLQFCV